MLPNRVKQPGVQLAVLLAVVFLLVAAGTLGPGSYFLHHDTPTQNVAAADLVEGCWTYTAATLAPMVMLFLPYALFGPSAVYEMVLLSLLGAVLAASLFLLAEAYTRSRRWALLGALWFAGLPIILYYTRTHIGYPLAFYGLGLLLHTRKHYTWAGLAFGLAFTSHFNYLVPLAFWMLWAFITDRETRSIRSMAQLGLGFLLPLLLLETARFFFTGVPFGWLQEEIRDALRLAGQTASSESWPVTHLIRLIGFSNGWLNAVLLLSGVAYPLFRARRPSLMDSIYLSGWSVLVFYSLQVSLLHNTFLTPRMFAAIYPNLALASIYTGWQAADWLKTRLKPASWAVSQVVGCGIVLVVLPLSTLDAALDALVGSRTAYQEVDNLLAEAAASRLPVRYYGNFLTGLYWGHRHDLFVNTNETDVDRVLQDTQAVLVFEDADSPALEQFYSSPSFDPAAYTITTIPHRIAYRPAWAENYGVGPQALHDLSWLIYAHRPNADTTTLVVLWPNRPTGEFAARSDPDQYIFTYEGGCSLPHPFDGPDGAGWNYYHLLWDKLKQLVHTLRTGGVGAGLELVRGWLQS